MPSVTWDAAFEASPADSDEAKYGATKIRQLKLAVSERLELELNFKTGTQPLLKAGQAAVCYSGNAAQIAALANVANGALAWSTTANCFQRSNGTAYANLSIDHGTLAGLSDDDHTQYLKLDKVGQTISANISVAANITLDGRDVGADGTKVDTLYAANNIVQIASNVTGNQANGTTAIPFDDTIPANTEGTEMMSCSITPLNANNKLLVSVRALVSCANDRSVAAALFRDSGANALAVGFSTITAANETEVVAFDYVANANAASNTTFKVNIGASQAFKVTLNGINGARWFGGVAASSIIIKEFGKSS